MRNITTATPTLSAPRVQLHEDTEVEFLPLFSVNEQGFDEHQQEDYPEVLPILALKNTVLFPGVIIPITVGRDRSIAALTDAHKGDKNVAVITQRDLDVAEPVQADLYTIGVVAKILKVLKMPDGSTTAILQGRQRLEPVSYTHLTLPTTPYV